MTNQWHYKSCAPTENNNIQDRRADDKPTALVMCSNRKQQKSSWQTLSSACAQKTRHKTDRNAWSMDFKPPKLNQD